MRYLSVCSGIEAASVAWHPLGWEPIGFAEIEPFPSAVLAHHFPNVPNHGDMTKYKEWEIEPGTIDILVGGTPCQSFSVAGLRKGLSDPRGNLMLTFGAIADYLRPSWIVWENVPGVLSSHRGRDFGTFLGMLGELGFGFAYRILDAQFYNVAQRRRRVFVVGYLGDWRRAAAVLFESESLRWNPPPSREAREETAGGAGRGPIELYENHAQDSRVRRIDIPSLHAKAGTGGGNLPILMEPRHEIACFGGNNQSGPIEIATACRAKGGTGHGDFESETFVAQTFPTLTAKAGDNCGRDFETGGFQITKPALQECRGIQPSPVAFPANLSGTQCASVENLSPSMGAKNPTAVAIRTANTNANGHGVAEEVAHTLDQAQGQAVALHSAVRRLTPRECERLQGFPDDWTCIPWKGRPAEDCPDGPRYKACGNSMAVPVMRWIGERINKVRAMAFKGDCRNA